jgi:hypothetical protein
VPWKAVDNAIVTAEHVKNELPDLTKDRLQQLPNEHIVFFWASTAFLRVKPTGQQERTLDVVSVVGDSVGTVRRTESPQWKLNGGDHPTCCEFVAVGRRYIEDLPQFPPIILALMVVWEDSIAYRVSTAEINEEAWIDQQPQWKLVAMM